MQTYPCHASPEEFRSYLEELGARRADPEAGFFGPDSLLWKLSQESILYLGGLRALLCQLSHPAVAQGVYDHSNFLHDPIGRAYRTFQAVYGIVFGNREKAIEAAYRTFLIHSKVQGVIRDPDSPLAGKPYRANDPDPLYWVHATLVESTLFAYQVFIRTLTPREKRQFFEEAKLFLSLFGVPEEYGPQTLEEFLAYFQERLHSPLHRFTREGRELARAILSGAYFLRTFPLLKPGNLFLASGTVPEPLRSDLKIPRSKPLLRGFQVFARAVRRLYPNLPELVRMIPEARRAYRRVHRYRKAA